LRNLEHVSITGQKLNIFVVESDDDVRIAVSDLSAAQTIGFDTETTYKLGFEQDPQAGLDPYRSRLRLIQLAKRDGTVYVIDNFKITAVGRALIAELLSSDANIKVGHNLKFDIKMTRYHLGIVRFGKIFCTEIVSRLVTSGIEFLRISLMRSAAEHLGVAIDKEEQRSDWSKKNLTLQQLRYAAEDAFVPLLIREVLVKKVIELDIVNVTRLELEALDAVCVMELTGFKLVEERWLEAEGTMEQRRIEVAEKIWDALEDVEPQRRLMANTPLFKIGSQQIMTELLLDFGIELPETGKEKKARPKKKKTTLNDVSTGLLFGDISTSSSSIHVPKTKDLDPKRKTTRNWKIKPLADRFAIISLLIEWRELNKRKTSYGKEYLDNINPVTGRIHADYDPLRTVTGRYSCSKPNLQQIPKLKAYRRSFMPEIGWKFVGADYSQIELRELAEFSGDEGFIEAFKSGMDFHDATTLQMFGDKLTFPGGADKPPKKGTPEYAEWEQTESYELWTKYRTYAKNINFGIPYGMGAFTLSIRTGMTLEEAEGHLRNYEKRFPAVIRYLRACATEVRLTHQIRTVSGRIAKFNFDPRDKDAVGHAERNGKNTPIQGGNADILKRALKLMHEELFAAGLLEPIGGAIKLVNIVHDEIITEVQDGYEERAIGMLQRAMKSAAEEVLVRVPVKVDPAVSTEWSK